MISILKAIHDELDQAVASAYGWSGDLSDEHILQNLVVLNAERAAEERNGHIRWLRPEYQAPGETITQQNITGVQETPDEIQTISLEAKPWPKQSKEQLATLLEHFRTNPETWTLAQLTTRFKGAKAKTISDHLETMEWFGMLVREEQDKGSIWWHLA